MRAGRAEQHHRLEVMLANIEWNVATLREELLGADREDEHRRAGGAVAQPDGGEQAGSQVPAESPAPDIPDLVAEACARPVVQALADVFPGDTITAVEPLSADASADTATSRPSSAVTTRRTTS